MLDWFSSGNCRRSNSQTRHVDGYVEFHTHGRFPKARQPHFSQAWHLLLLQTSIVRWLVLLVHWQSDIALEFHTHGRFPKARQPHFSQAVSLLLISCNPICALGYTAASWVFFKDRIEDEEEMLLLFFGREYVDYSRRVPTGLPFIKGYSGDVEELLSHTS